MRTRTLLLLAISCGLVILVAGGIQLLRMAGQEPARILHLGDTGSAGDATVVVRAYDEHGGVGVVTVTVSGVDDPNGLAGFTLAGTGAKAGAESKGDQACTGLSVAPVTCTLTFTTSGMRTDDRLLLFHRADETVRWILV